MKTIEMIKQDNWKMLDESLANQDAVNVSFARGALCWLHRP